MGPDEKDNRGGTLRERWLDKEGRVIADFEDSKLMMLTYWSDPKGFGELVKRTAKVVIGE